MDTGIRSTCTLWDEVTQKVFDKVGAVWLVKIASHESPAYGSVELEPYKFSTQLPDG